MDVPPKSWFIQYVLMMWLQILVIVPFDLETIDSKSDEGDGRTLL